MVKVELSEFSYVERTQLKWGKSLRFTLCIQIGLPDNQFIELGWEGNLAYFNMDGTLRWGPPLNRVGSGLGRNRQYHWINPVFYNMVLDKLLAPQAEGGGANILKNLKTPISELLKKKTAQSVDPSLPTLLKSEYE